MSVAKAEQAKRESDRERSLVQAADGGAREYYRVAGYGKLAGTADRSEIAVGALRAAKRNVQVDVSRKGNAVAQVFRDQVP